PPFMLFPYTTLFRSAANARLVPSLRLWSIRTFVRRPKPECSVRKSFPGHPPKSRNLQPLAHRFSPEGGSSDSVLLQPGTIHARQDRKSTRLNSSHEW